MKRATRNTLCAARCFATWRPFGRARAPSGSSSEPVGLDQDGASSGNSITDARSVTAIKGRTIGVSRVSRAKPCVVRWRSVS